MSKKLTALLILNFLLKGCHVLEEIDKQINMYQFFLNIEVQLLNEKM
jgi:hypothetical protein